MTDITEFYRHLSRDACPPLSQHCQTQVDVLAKQISNTVYDMEMHRFRAQALAQDAESAKQLVRPPATYNDATSLTGLKVVQYIQTQTSEYMEGLTKISYSVGVTAQKEAVVMRVITVVALVYLPGTFVSVSCTSIMNAIVSTNTA